MVVVIAVGSTAVATVTIVADNDFIVHTILYYDEPHGGRLPIRTDLHTAESNLWLIASISNQTHTGILVVLREWLFLTGGILPFLFLCPAEVP